MKAMFETPEGEKVVSQLVLKNVKLNVGHDLCGAFCDFYLNKKKLGYFNDDGHGGETEIVYVNDAAKKEFEKFITDNNVLKIMADCDLVIGDFNDMHSQAETLINCAIDYAETLKLRKKNNAQIEKNLKKECVDSIVFGPEDKKRVMRFKFDLEFVVRHYGARGLESIQKTYDKIKNELKEGEKIYNTNLEALGVKL